MINTAFNQGELGQVLIDRLDKAAQCSEPGPGVTRLFCSQAHRQVLPLISRWMEQAGLTPQLDAAGNLVGRCPKAQAGKKLSLWAPIKIQ
ncbi:hypothetical protein HORIV_63180 [Vreelandella olivaria]|uniref:Uncharacterized protein n=1 Tax=Vreelandella olivaria TaxID=390919 RepID=A0ABM7GT97_9GAMM|nr:hypothetical protein HORIV_63180 [Halomonas olivaria]